MKLQRRNLSLQVPAVQGDDVKLLQSELQQLGYPIAPNELGSSSFGQATLQAVIDFQTRHGLETTGAVDARTALLITGRLEELYATHTLASVSSLTLGPVDWG
jgi:peptidoglycan hydrolase-like protein with peptidoglycan-binding domain